MNTTTDQFKYQITPFQALDRWLVLGHTSNKYMAGETPNLDGQVVKACLDLDWKRTIDRIVEVSVRGQVPKNDTAIYGLAVCSSHKLQDNHNTQRVQKYALAELSSVCRTGTHLCQFVAAIKPMRGMGRALKAAINSWYTNRSPDQLAYQLVKYRNRAGFSHRDILRLTHLPDEQVVASHDSFTARSAVRATLRWAVDPSNSGARSVQRAEGSAPTVYSPVHSLPAIIQDFESLKSFYADPAHKSKDLEKRHSAMELLTGSSLTHEMLPNEMKDEPEVWRHLIPKMGLTALVRNLGKMSKLNLFEGLNAQTKLVVSRLSDSEEVIRARIHPIQLLSALRTYQSGRGIKGSLTWPVSQPIVAALEKAFYLSFQAVEPSGKNFMLAIDISGSMTSGEIAGVPGLSPHVAAAVMAMVTVKSEPWCEVYGFSSGNDLKRLEVNANSSLAEAMRATQGPFGCTDCSQPARYARTHSLPVDVFCIYTDNEVNSGSPPTAELNRYRKECNSKARQVVIAMAVTDFTIANPADPGQMDLVGMDSATPAIISLFSGMEL